MNRIFRLRRDRGFTLPEVLVTITSLAVFSLILVSMLIMGMRYLRKGNADIRAQNTCRNIVDAVMNEMHEGMPNPDATTGYLSISTTAKPTAVLVPNYSTPEGEDIDREPAAIPDRVADYVTFTKPNYSVFDPMSSGFDRTDPNNYEQITYSVIDEGTKLIRTKREISGGTLQSPETAILAETPNGVINLKIAWVSEKQFKVRVTVTEDIGQDSEKMRESLTTVYILGD